LKNVVFYVALATYSCLLANGSFLYCVRFNYGARGCWLAARFLGLLVGEGAAPLEGFFW